MDFGAYFMNNLLKDYLRFSKKETNGILVLSGIILSIIIATACLPLIFPNKEIDTLEWDKQVAAYMNAIELEARSNEITIEYEPFNPNEIDIDKWQRLGVSERTARTIRNYLNKGGQFRKKEDLKKIYGFREEDYIALEPFIVIEKRSYQKTTKPIFEETTIAYSEKRSKQNELNLKYFDPNEVSKNELIDMGIPVKTVNIWVNYRNKGAQFKDPSDLSKIYSMTDDLLAKLKPFIVIKMDSSSVESISAEDYEERKSDFSKFEDKKSEVIIPIDLIVDINSNEIERWEPLEVINAALATRIIKYGQILGGYVSKEQLLEVYGFPKYHWELLAPHLIEDGQEVKKIAINEASRFDMQRHPYISKLFAYWISEVRKTKKFTSSEELIESEMITTEELKKLSPYLQF